MNEPLMECELRAWTGLDGRPHPLVWHEAAHALVGHRLGMRVELVDMTGLKAPCPSCGLDETTLPEAERARAMGLSALAGPIAESMADGEPPRWREDGHVAKDAAALLTASVADQVELLQAWKREARRMLESDPAFEPLVYELAEREVMTGEDVEAFLRAVEVMKYPVTEHEGHLLVEVEGRRYLVDTGSPWSIGDQPVRLAGREFAMQSNDLMGNTCESLAAMVGTPFDGLLGTDVLAEFDLEISLRDGTLGFSGAQLDMAGGTPLESVTGVPLLECEVGGQPVKMFFDTGAPLSYLSEECVQGCTAMGQQEDFHPLFGRFEVSTYAVLLSAWGQEMTIRAGRMPPIMEAALGFGGADGILGTEVLKHGVLRMSQRQGRAALMIN